MTGGTEDGEAGWGQIGSEGAEVEGGGVGWLEVPRRMMAFRGWQLLVGRQVWEELG